VIAGLGMLPAIGLDDEPSFRASEVDDVWRYHELPPEAPAQLPVAQHLPQRPLGVDRIVTAALARAGSAARRRAYFVWDPAWLAPSLTLPASEGGNQPR